MRWALRTFLRFLFSRFVNPCYHADFLPDTCHSASVSVQASALSAWVSLRRLRPSGREFLLSGLADG